MSSFVRMFFTPPVKTVLIAPLPMAVVAGLFSGADRAITAFAESWLVAIEVTILWLLLVVPLIAFFGKNRNDDFECIRVVLVSAIGGCCIGALVGYFGGHALPSIGGIPSRTAVGTALAYAYVSLIGGVFLYRDPFFREGA